MAHTCTHLWQSRCLTRQFVLVAKGIGCNGAYCHFRVPPAGAARIGFSRARQVTGLKLYDVRIRDHAREERHMANSHERWTDDPFVNPNQLTEKERERHEAIKAAYREAWQGNWQPGIDLGIFPKDAAERGTPGIL